MNKYPLASDTWGAEELTAIQDVISSGKFTMGEKVKRFEAEFASYHNSDFAVMTNSGSSANLIMLASILYSDHFPKTGNIIVPAVSWSTTYFPVSQMGYKLRFVDIDIDTFNLDHEKVEAAIDHETVGILAVNLLGNPCDLKKLDAIAKRNNIFLIEDNCESLGASIDNKLTGTFGLMGTSSFFFSHHIQTMEGGMVLTDSEELSHYLRSLRAHGWVRDLPKESNLYKKSDFDFQERFKFILPGYCVRPLEMSGAVGTSQLIKWPKMLENRKNNAAYLISRITEIEFLKLQKEFGQSSWFGFGFIICSPKIERNAFIQYLEDCGIETRPIVAGNFVNNPVIDLLDHDIFDNLQYSEVLDKDGFFIGNDSIDLTEKIDYFIEICRGYKN